MKPNQLINHSFRRKGAICILREIIKDELYKVNYYDRETKKTRFGLGITGTGIDYYGNKFCVKNITDIKKEEI